VKWFFNLIQPILYRKKGSKKNFRLDHNLPRYLSFVYLRVFSMYAYILFAYSEAILCAAKTALNLPFSPFALKFSEYAELMKNTQKEIFTFWLS
jgi:hypothetical protein